MKNNTLKNARRWCAAQFKKRRPDRRYEHPSHLGAEILREAEKRFGLGTFGTEGFCDDCGEHGVSYLNMGDTYAETLCFLSEPRRFTVSSWGDIAEKHPGWYGGEE